MLLDGYYYTVPSVTHKEILYALDAGVRVVGAASMGALRAVEMAPAGMEGVGWVVERFADGSLEGDDEVAILHGDADSGYQPLTVALVEVRAAAEELLDGDADPDLASGLETLIGRLAALPFTERRPGKVARWADELLPEEAAGRLAALLDPASDNAGVKQRDARAALELARTPRPGDPRAPSSQPVSEQTGFFGFFRDAYLGPARPATGDGPTWLDAWRIAQLLHPDVPAQVERLRLRFLRASLAEREGLEPEPGEIDRRVDALEECYAARDLPSLPRVELALEARIELLAERADAAHPSPAATYARLAERLGLATVDPQAALLELATARFDLVPGWSLARAFTCSPLAAPAVELARSAAEVEACYVRWAGRERPRQEDLRRLAAELWDVSVDRVPFYGIARGLYQSHGFDLGLDRALALVAAAERLPEAINDYPARRQALLATRWQELPALQGTGA